MDAHFLTTFLDLDETAPLSVAPTVMRERLEGLWEALPPVAQADIAAQSNPQALQKLFRLSKFAFEQCTRRPAIMAELADTGGFAVTAEGRDFMSLFEAFSGDKPPLDTLALRLRLFRNREMVGIIYRDLMRLGSLETTTRDLSDLADACIEIALCGAEAGMPERLGRPMDGDRPMRLMVVGMGKLGAGELNLSSDIDLIFFYARKGETEGGTRSQSHDEYFTRLGQKTIQLLDQVTAEGFVFRVDMRLRPWGDSGPLVMSQAAAEQYYQTQGRDWERYAMIKARVVAGDRQGGAHLLDMLRPFVFRRYIDFSVIEALRQMKSMIRAEEQRRGLQRNLKLGAGGIREVEFIAQVFQLIHGGRLPFLQDRRLLVVLSRLARLQLLDLSIVRLLSAGYRFLRDSEHAIQAWQDEQTQMLPDSDAGRQRLAEAMGFGDWAGYSQQLEDHRQFIRTVFDDLIQPPGGERSNATNPWDSWWNSTDDRPDLFREAGYEDPEQACRMVVSFRSSKALQQVSADGRKRIDEFMPVLLQMCTEMRTPDRALIRMLPIVEAVRRRTAYIVLLIENHHALRHLMTLCHESLHIAEQIARHPVHLDDFVSAQEMFAPLDKAALRAELDLHLSGVDDEERMMDVLREFRLTQFMRVAAAEIEGTLPLMNVSDSLTWIAEVVLDEAVSLSWQMMCRRYGPPPAGADGEWPGLVVVGYGKLGGIELGYNSDLDIVFVHDAPAGQSTTGERAIDLGVFMTRVAQKVTHILDSHTAHGRLYELDLRLRPNGLSGPFVSTLAAFEKYQLNEAWTWEQQALVRARVVAGNKPALAGGFEQLRTALLTRPRPLVALHRDVVDMREKMRAQKLGQNDHGQWMNKTGFQLKHDRGGIVDIEFMVQYAVLAWSHTHPSLARWSDNIRILDAMADVGLISSEERTALQDAYIAFRGAAHRKALQHEASVVSAEYFQTHRQAVALVWQRLMVDDSSAEQE